MQLLKPSFLLLLFFISFIPAPSLAQEWTTVILVRHAEKMNGESKDPLLSKEGRKQAQQLANLLGSTDITAIYSTPFKRTTQTVEQLAQKKGLDIKAYNPFNQTFLDSLLYNEKGGTILISGHSNTTPYLANLLIGEERFDQLDESDYGNIFIITVKEKGKARLIHLRY